jgi:O-antigen ligase
LLLGAYFQKEYLINKILSQGAIIILVASLLTSFSRGALFGFLSGLAYLLIVAKKTRVLMNIGAISVILLIAVNTFFPLALYRYFNLFEQGTEAHSVKGRMNAISNAAEQISNDPIILLTGIGFDKVGSIIDINAESSANDSNKWAGQAGSPDNYYVLLILAGGISALVVFLAILYVLIKEALKVARATADPFIKGLAASSGAIFLAYFIFGFTVDLWGNFPSNFYFWLLAGMLLCAKRLARKAT